MKKLVGAFIIDVVTLAIMGYAGFAVGVLTEDLIKQEEETERLKREIAKLEKEMEEA